MFTVYLLLGAKFTLLCSAHVCVYKVFVWGVCVCVFCTNEGADTSTEVGEV